MEPDRKRRWPFGPVRTLVLVAFAAALLIWAAQIAFMAFFAVQEPQSVPDPEDVITNAPAQERGGSSDGGDLTGAPTQAAPDEPDSP